MTGEAPPPAFPGGAFFDHVSEDDVRRLLGPGWSRQDVRLQAAWQFALHGHSAEVVAAAFDVPLSFAELLVTRARRAADVGHTG